MLLELQNLFWLLELKKIHFEVEKSIFFWKYGMGPIRNFGEGRVQKWKGLFSSGNLGWVQFVILDIFITKNEGSQKNPPCFKC